MQNPRRQGARARAGGSDPYEVCVLLLEKCAWDVWSCVETHAPDLLRFAQAREVAGDYFSPRNLASRAPFDRRFKRHRVNAVRCKLRLNSDRDRGFQSRALRVFSPRAPHPRARMSLSLSPVCSIDSSSPYQFCLSALAAPRPTRPRARRQLSVTLSSRPHVSMTAPRGFGSLGSGLAAFQAARLV